MIKFMDTERMAGARDRAGWGGGGKRSYYLTGTEFQFYMMKSVLQMVGGTNGEQHEGTSRYPAAHLHVTQTVNLLLRIILPQLLWPSFSPFVLP